MLWYTTVTIIRDTLYIVYCTLYNTHYTALCMPCKVPWVRHSHSPVQGDVSAEQRLNACDTVQEDTNAVLLAHVFVYMIQHDVLGRSE